MPHRTWAAATWQDNSKVVTASSSAALRRTTADADGLKSLFSPSNKTDFRSLALGVQRAWQAFKILRPPIVALNLPAAPHLAHP